MVRKTFFNKVGGFSESLRLHQDSDFCMKAAAVGNLVPGWLKDPMAVRRVHSGDRFVRPREDALQSRLLQWRALDEWVTETKQGRGRRLIIIYRLFGYLKAHYRRKGNYLSAVLYFAVNRLMRLVISVRCQLFGVASF